MLMSNVESLSMAHDRSVTHGYGADVCIICISILHDAHHDLDGYLHQSLDSYDPHPAIPFKHQSWSLLPLPSTYSRGVLQLELVAMTTGSQWYHSWSLLPLAQYCTTLYHCTITLYHYGLAMKALQTTNCSINAIIIVPRYQLSTHQACGGRIQTPK